MSMTGFSLDVQCQAFSWDMGSDVGAPDPELHSSVYSAQLWYMLNKRTLTFRGVVTGKDCDIAILNLTSHDIPAVNFPSSRCLRCQRGPPPLTACNWLHLPANHWLPRSPPPDRTSLVQHMDGPGSPRESSKWKTPQGVACIRTPCRDGNDFHQIRANPELGYIEF